MGEALRGGAKEPCGKGQFCILITVVVTQIYTRAEVAQSYTHARTSACTTGEVRSLVGCTNVSVGSAAATRHVVIGGDLGAGYTGPLHYFTPF